MNITALVAGGISLVGAGFLTGIALTRHLTADALHKAAALRGALINMTAERDRWKRAAALQQRSRDRHLRIIGSDQ